MDQPFAPPSLLSALAHSEQVLDQIRSILY